MTFLGLELLEVVFSKSSGPTSADGQDAVRGQPRLQVANGPLQAISCLRKCKPAVFGRHAGLRDSRPSDFGPLRGVHGVCGFRRLSARRSLCQSCWTRRSNAESNREGRAIGLLSQKRVRWVAKGRPMPGAISVRCLALVSKNREWHRRRRLSWLGRPRLRWCASRCS